MNKNADLMNQYYEPPKPPQWIELVRKVGAYEAESRIRHGEAPQQSEIAVALGLDQPAVSKALKIYPWLHDPRVAASPSLREAYLLITEYEKLEIDAAMQSLLGVEISPHVLGNLVDVWSPRRPNPNTQTPFARSRSAKDALARKIAEHLAKYGISIDWDIKSLTSTIKEALD